MSSIGLKHVAPPLDRAIHSSEIVAANQGRWTGFDLICISQAPQAFHTVNALLPWNFPRHADMPATVLIDRWAGVG